MQQQPTSFEPVSPVERMFADMSKTFVIIDIEKIHEQIEYYLKQLLILVGMDRTTLFKFANDKSVDSYFVACLGDIERPQIEAFNANGPYLSQLWEGRSLQTDNGVENFMSAEELKAARFNKKTTGHIAIPFEIEGKIWGAISMTRLEVEPVWDPNLIERVTYFGQFIAAVLDRAALLRANASQQVALQRLSHHLLQSQESERRHISKQLHDRFSQGLAALLFESQQIFSDELTTLNPELSHKTQQVVAQVQKMSRDMQKMSRDMQKMSRALHPALIEDIGLVAALNAEIKQHSDKVDYPIELEAIGDYQQNQDIDLCIFRIVQDLLSVLTLSEQPAGHIFVVLTFMPDCVELFVDIDGELFLPELLVSTIKERAGLHDSELVMRRDEHGVKLMIALNVINQSQAG